ncbi:MAG: hypothetical protein DRJ07_08715, partial [Bacteroidetes bacterium]
DILRKHNCDYIIDQKYAKENTAAQYDKLVPNKCIKLLGPQYAILSSDYKNNKINKSKSFNILFSLGGGGDLNIIRKIISKLANEKIVLQVVIGPLSRGKKEIKELAKKHKSVQLIENAPTLYPYYKEASLFIGTLGTSFYECRALKIPSITFSTAKNHEKNNKELSYLEDYGHYLHLNLNELQVTDSMVSLILLISGKIKRIRELSNKAIINVDGFGANRIASILCGYEKAIEINYTPPEVPGENFQYINSNLAIEEVTDTDVNHYLYARNLQKNRQNMIVNQPISKLEHYNWWFNNQRKSYLLKKNNERKLYIWHQNMLFKENDYLIGGWFVCENDDTSFEVSSAALDWQLKATAKIYPNSVWIAIIKKTNKYVNLLNKYMGFVEVKKGDKEYFAIKKFFNNPSFNEYNFVKYIFKAQEI